MSAGSIVLDLLLRTGSFITDTKRAEKAVKDFEGSAKKLGDTFLKIAGFASAGAAVAKITQEFHQAVDAMDAFNDLKDATGASIENISALDAVARQTGGTFETVEGALIKFNKVLGEAGKGSEAAKLLKSIGLNAEELKRIDPAEALRRTAVALSGFADDGNKARFMQVLFGKSLKEMAPFLKDLAEQEKLVAKTTTAAAEEAEKYNKHLYQFGAAVEDFKRGVASSLLPALNETIQKFKDAQEEFGIFKALLKLDQKIQVIQVGFSGPDDNVTKRISAYRKEIDELTISLEKHQKFQQGNAGVNAKTRSAAQIADIEARLAELKRQEAVARAIQARGLPQAVYGHEGGLRTGESAGKPSLPDKPDPAATAALKKELAGQIQAIEAAGKLKADAVGFENQRLDALYSSGILSLADYTQQQKHLRREALDVAVSTIDQQIAVQKKLADLAEKPEDVQEALNAVKKLQAERAAAVQKSAQEGKLALFKEDAAVRQLRTSYDSLRATILDLRGDAKGAAQIGIDRQVQEAQRLFNQSERLPPAKKLPEGEKATELRRLLEGQLALSTSQAEYNQLLEKQRVIEEEILLAAEHGGATEEQTIKALTAARQEALVQMGETVVRAQQLAAALGTPEAIKFAEDLGLAYKRAAAEADVGLKRLRDSAKEASRTVYDSLGAGLEQALTGKFDGILKSWGNMLVQMVNKAIAADLMSAITGGKSGPGGNAAGIWSGLASVVGSFFGSGVGSTGNAGMGDYKGYYDSLQHRAIGGPVGSGQTYLVGEQGPELLRMGSMAGHISPNRVFEREKTSPSAFNAGNAQPIVNINNMGPPIKADVKSERQPDGSQMLTILIDAVAKDINSGGKIGQATQGRYGLKPVLPRRS